MSREQSRKMSMIESVTNQAISFVMDVILTLTVLNWIWGVEISFLASLPMAGMFVAVGIVRNYFVRRWFSKYDNA